MEALKSINIGHAREVLIMMSFSSKRYAPYVTR